MTRTLQLALALVWLTAVTGHLQAAHAVEPATERTRDATGAQAVEQAARRSLAEKVAVGQERYETRKTYRRALVASLNEQAEAARVRSQQDFGPGGVNSHESEAAVGAHPIAFLIWSVFALGAILFLWRRRHGLRAALSVLPLAY